MKQWWTKLAARIDAMSLRERGFVFLSVILVVAAMADVLLLSPAQIAYRQLVQSHTSQEAELTRLRAEMTVLARPEDASKSAQAELAASQVQLESVMRDIRALAPVVDYGPPLEQVLVQFLRRQPGLTLLSTSTLAPEVFSAGTNKAVGAVPGLIKRGLELRVEGPYAELVRYVKSLETALPNLRWGVLTVQKGPQMAELTLHVFVVGVQP